MLHLEQNPQGGVHQDLHQKAGQVPPAGNYVPFGTGRGQAGAGEGVVKGVQQAGHAGDV